VSLPQIDWAGASALAPRRASPLTLEEYVAGLRAAGVPVVPGAHGSYWVASAERVARRLPTFDLTVPSPEEVDQALLGTRALIASYATEADATSRANTWLYLCDDRHYSLQQRPAAMRRNVRRASRELVVAPLSSAEVMTYGHRAFCDTRWRNALDDGSLAGFYRYFARHVGLPGREYLGAWREGQLAGFVTIVRVDDWAELGLFSMTSMLPYRPNDALLYATLSSYLAAPDCRVVCYGLSSIEPGCTSSGLHRFKVKVGFEAKPVHRVFVLRRGLRSFASRLTLRSALFTIDAAIRIRPRNRRLKKLGGRLGAILRAPTACGSVSGRRVFNGGGAPQHPKQLLTT
jgi:hypothetical protein